MRPVESKQNEMLIGGISARDLVKEFGSPLYVYNETVIKDSFRMINTSINYEKKRIHYALKANNNLRILQILEKEGAYIDAVSREEIMLSMKANYSAQKILFTGINLGDNDIDFAVQNGVMVNLGSLAALERYGSRYPGTTVSIRVNPDMGAGHHDHVITGGRESKFGIYYSHKGQNDLEKAAEIAGLNKLRISGIHMHIGSGILDEKKFISLMQIILDIAARFKNLEFIDIGGGIGVPYKPEEHDFNFKTFGKRIDEMMRSFTKQYGSSPYLALEPGRFLVAESGTLLCTVMDLKNTPSYTFAGVDSGFNHLPRPMAYGSYHPVINASRIEGLKKEYAVSGYLCESGDVFTRNENGIKPQQITEIKIGDVLAILNTGAYGYSMASNYNARPRPAEVLVTGGEARLIRKRETFEDMLRTQV